MTTFNFEHEYFWNGKRYQQVVNGVINGDSFPVENKNLVKFGQLTKKL